MYKEHGETMSSKELIIEEIDLPLENMESLGKIIINA